MTEQSNPGPVIALSTNAAWNIVNFRAGLVRRLQLEGYRVVAIVPADAHGATLEAMGVELLPIAMNSQGVSPIRDLRLLGDYARLLRRQRPVALLAWTAKPNIYGNLAARWANIPTINNVSGLGTAFIKRGLLTGIVATLYRLAFASSSTVFFQNDDDRRLFLRARLVQPDRARLLPGSGIDLDHFAPRPLPADPRRPFTFLLVARMLRDKGVGEFVEAARLVRARCPDVRFQLLGFLDVANRTAISRAEMASWVAEGVIDYLGQADDVRPFISAADCVVLPSYREGMPRTLLEAAAMARPLIATDVPGCIEIARAGENALLCRVRDSHSLAEAMVAMIELGPAHRATMGAAGRRIAEREFGDAIVTTRYLDALAAALGDKSAAPGRRERSSIQ